MLYTCCAQCCMHVVYSVVHIVIHLLYTAVYACCTQQVVVLQQQIQLQQNETDKLRSDNVKLYEKIKFLQGYSASKVQCAVVY